MARMAALRAGAGLGALAFSALVIACEVPPRPSPPPEAPAPADRETVFSIEDGPMTLSMTRIRTEGWRGRLVTVSFAPGERQVRVVASEAPRALDRIVADIATQPFAAVNGGFYDTDGEAMGLVRADGAEVHPLTERGGSGVFFMEDGRPRIVQRDAYVASDRIRDAVQSIDRVVEGGRSVVREDPSARRAARSAVAIDERDVLHFAIAFDERAIAREEGARIVLDEDSGTTGPTPGELASLLARAPAEGGLGAVSALALDGGFSTSLTVKSARRALRVVAYRATINAIVASSTAAD
jgi:hypothetical protein